MFSLAIRSRATEDAIHWQVVVEASENGNHQLGHQVVTSSVVDFHLHSGRPDVSDSEVTEVEDAFFGVDDLSVRIVDQVQKEAGL